MGFGRFKGGPFAEIEAEAVSSTPVPFAAPPLRVGVIGATLSGLATAWELEQNGHRVVVFDHGSAQERYQPLELKHPDGRRRTFPSVPGVQADGGWLEQWVSRFGVQLDRTTTALIDSLDQPITPPKPDRELRVLDLRAADERRVTRSVRSWFEERGLGRCREWISLEFARAGRGDLADPEIPTFIALEAARSLGLIRAVSRDALFHIRGGIEFLCRRIASELDDIRINRVRAVRRTGHRIAIETVGSEEFDRLVIACAPALALKFLDAGELETRTLNLVRTKRKLAALYSYAPGSSATPPTTMTTRVAREPAECVTCFHFGQDRVVRIETHFETSEELVAARERIASEAARVAGPDARPAAEVIVGALPFVRADDLGTSTFEDFVTLQGYRGTYFTDLPVRADFPTTQIGVAAWLRRRLAARSRSHAQPIGPRLPNPPPELGPVHEPAEMRAILWAEARALEAQGLWSEAAAAYERLVAPGEIEALSKLAVVYERLGKPHAASRCYEKLADEYLVLARVSHDRAQALAIDVPDAPDE
ncbi:MAG: NAD(P)-binding protein [Deltaproteobacteria bacterium]|nr:NAD(P)-binding protein [Deltaproteobacteria bacterium]